MILDKPCLVLGILVLIYALFFPPIYSSIDEHSYIKNASLLVKGTLFVEDPENACRAGAFVEGKGYIAPQFLGRSLFLLPFLFLGQASIKLSGFIVCLMNFALLFFIFRKLKVPDKYALLLLLYPAMVWIARTVYAESLVLTALLAGAYFYLNANAKSWLASGAFFGLALIVRPDSIFAFAAFLLNRNWKKSALLMAGFLPFFIAIFWLNSVLYGSALSTGYGGILAILSRRVVDLPNLLVLVGVLSLIYPLMLFSPFFVKKEFPLFWQYVFLSGYFIYLATVTYVFGFDLSLSSIPTLFSARLRYFVPLIGLLLIPYGMFLNKIINNKFREKLYYVIIICLLGIALVASYIHQDFLLKRLAVQEQILSNIPGNALVVGSSDDCMYFVQGMPSARKYLNAELGADLANNPEHLQIEDFIDENTYYIQLEYSNLKGNTSVRQKTVNAERQAIVDLLKGKMVVSVFGTDTPHFLQISKEVG